MPWRGSSRRELLALGAAGATCALGASAWAWPSPGRAHFAGSQGELDVLARWIAVTPRDRVLARALRELRAGLTTERLLAALYVAAAREICPTIARFNHAALVVSSIDQLGQGVPEEQRRTPALWCLDSFSLPAGGRPLPRRVVLPGLERGFTSRHDDPPRATSAWRN